MESTFRKLQIIQINYSFNDLMKAWISSTIVELERQNKHYFELDIDNLSGKLKEEIMSASKNKHRCHEQNIHYLCARHVEDAKVHVETNCCLIMYVMLLDNKVIAEHRAQSIKL
ncbi:unnamed protein product [Lepeophtheirus salmonis]|uniref:(salmon louse) hypothetical protein n=1 Tax=Lepeophtheirus salmonis TaxID=72036 RepID=A0A7R8GZQ7_LEPSM|nr:unnamed protein product [Lepeophtheirus salmonis]CAF2757142.1 unnamed protein product [Lepeophtheirus salmonis]